MKDTNEQNSQLRKGLLELAVILVIKQGSVYASDILKKLKDSQLLVVEGTLYPLLSRLKNDGLLSYNWVESKSGPPRKYYQLTEQGKLFMAELSTTWNELVDAVNHISNKTINIK